MFEYRIPQEIKIKFTKEFMADFLAELSIVFDLEESMLCLEYLLNLESTYGWAKSFKHICRKYNLEDAFTYYDKLEWYDSDLFDDELLSLMKEYRLIKE